jgi:hypothetical protein
MSNTSNTLVIYVKDCISISREEKLGNVGYNLEVSVTFSCLIDVLTDVVGIVESTLIFTKGY